MKKDGTVSIGEAVRARCVEIGIAMVTRDDVIAAAQARMAPLLDHARATTCQIEARRCVIEMVQLGRLALAWRDGEPAPWPSRQEQETSHHGQAMHSWEVSR